MKIAVYAISRNEAQFVERFLSACCDADMVLVADTGSTDGTPSLLRQAGAEVHAISVVPWRFDDARNAALALVPYDVDVCISLDLDEILQPGWRPALEAAWRDDVSRAQYPFVASHRPDGSPGIQFLNNRIHSRSGYRWRHACHEGLYPDRTVEKLVTVSGLRVHHHPDESKSRSLYLDLLVTAAREEPHEPRMAHYLAREFWYAGRYREAVDEFRRYLAFPNNSFADERAASMIYIGKCLEALGDHGTPWFHRAIAESPDLREPWIALAEACYRQNDWVGCYASAVRGLTIAQKSSGYMSDPHCYGATPDDLASIAAWQIGLYDAALTHAKAALTLDPDDERLRRNVEYILENRTT